MPSYSPATEAVLAAFNRRFIELCGEFTPDWSAQCLAAALDALAVRVRGADDIRQDLFDISNELTRSDFLPEPHWIHTHD
jgi:hypothetical protein